MTVPTTAETLDWSAGVTAVRSRLESIVLAQDDDEPAALFRLVGVEKQHSLLQGLRGGARLLLDGPLGDYAFAMLEGPDIRITGDVGTGVGEGMSGGSLRVNGNCGDAAGYAMHGGTLAVYGHAGHDTGRFMDGGEIFIRGHAASCAGAGALSGALMIAGDAGPGLGDQMQDAVIYVRGSVASLGRGVVESPINAKDRLRLGLLMMNAGIRGEAKDFRRYVSQYSQQNGNDSHREIRMGGSSK